MTCGQAAGTRFFCWIPGLQTYTFAMRYSTCFIFISASRFHVTHLLVDQKQKKKKTEKQENVKYKDITIAQRKLGTTSAGLIGRERNKRRALLLFFSPSFFRMPFLLRLVKVINIFS